MTSGRRLTDQQARRLKQKRFAETNPPTSAQVGVVINNFGKRLIVENQKGELINCAVRQHLGKLVAGDKVIWQADVEENTGVVTELIARENLLSRPGFRGQTRMVASNLSLIGIVAGIEPGVHPDMLDRYLVAANQIAVTNLIIINKVDLLEEEDFAVIEELMLPYIELGIEIHLISTETKQGLDELKKRLKDETTVLVGVSGAGKSSLVNQLVPDANIRTSKLSQATGLGVHTTTTSVYYHLPQGGAIIDSPGVREFTPLPVELNKLEALYSDFQPYLGKCQFANCTHTNEPNCAIKQAVENEEIHYSRYQSFQRMLQDFEELK